MTAEDGGYRAKLLHAGYATAVGIYGDAVIITDVEDAVIDVNPAAETMLARRRVDLLGTSVRALLHPRTSGAGAEEGPRQWSGDVGFVHGDGLPGLARAVVVPVSDNAGQLLGAVWLCRDVTLAPGTGDAVPELDQQWQLTVEHAPIGIALLDLDGRWRWVNEELCQIVGYPAEALLQMTFQDLSHPDDQEPALSLLAQLLLGEITQYRLEKRYLHGRGHEVWVDLTVGLISRDDGEPLHLVAHIQDITHRRAAIEQLEDRASHDPLTGLTNREALLKDVEGNTQRGFALAYLDLDGFKQINDNFGHAAGDALLVVVSQRLTAALRPGDHAARLGGDEFAVLLGGLHDGAIRAIVQRILNSVAAPYHLYVGTVQITASIGVVISDPNATAENLLSRADAAMYQAKRRGKNSYFLA